MTIKNTGVETLIFIPRLLELQIFYLDLTFTVRIYADKK